MAASLVKKLGTASGASGTARTISIPAGGVPIGDLVVVAIACANAPTGVPTDTGGNVYALVVQSTAQRGIYMYYSRLTVALNAADTISVTCATASFVVQAAAQFTGIIATPLDKTAFKNGTPASTYLVSGATVATTQEDELVVSAFALVGGDIMVSRHTLLDALTDAGNNVSLGWQYEIVEEQQPFQQTATATSTTYDGVIGTFKATPRNVSLIESLGRRPVPMIQGPDVDRVMRMQQARR